MKCRLCKNKIVGYRLRYYCCVQHRNKFYNIKNRKYQTRWQINVRNKIADKPSQNKIQCLICKRWYIQVCSHIVQVHKLLSREYKQEFGLDVKKGRIPKWYSEIKSEITHNNGTIKNLKIGKKFWFKKGSKIAGRYDRSQETLERLKNLYKIKTTKI